MRRWIFLFAMLMGALAPLAAPGGTAHACSCVAKPTPTDLAFVDTVFAGTVIAIGKSAIQNSGAQHSVDFEVDRVWLGETDPAMRVHTAGSSASCGYDFEVGVRYLVYANSGEVNICNPTQPYSDSAVQLLEGVTGPGTPVERAPTATESPGDDDDGGLKADWRLVILLVAAIGAAGVAVGVVRRR